ncbi:MAG: nucleotidyltransferase family protein [Anaerolineae bacterium]|jgi:predicted nucleotidyltransferase|nr:nucleotidyltransferase family protein [Anaerolineae bacterium]
MLSQDIVRIIVPILEQHEVSHAAIFGSYARGSATPNSDIDLLVDLPPTKSLLDLVDLKLELEDALGRSVDVVTYRSLHPRIRDGVLADQVIIL